MPIPRILKSIAAGALLSGLVSFGGVVEPLQAEAATRGSDFVTKDVKWVACEKSAFIDGVIEMQYSARVVANRRWVLDQNIYTRYIEKPHVIDPLFIVTTYNKCGKGRKKKANSDQFTVLTGWSGKWATINWSAGVGLSLSAGGPGISISPSVSVKNSERTVTTVRESVYAKRKSWTGRMEYGDLTWDDVFNMSESGRSDVYPSVKLYVHPFVEYQTADGSDFHDFKAHTVKLK